MVVVGVEFDTTLWRTCHFSSGIIIIMGSTKFLIALVLKTEKQELTELLQNKEFVKKSSE